MDKRQGRQDPASTLDVFGYLVCNDAQVRRGDGVEFSTPADRWSYALQYRLPNPLPVPCVIEATAAVEEGRIGLGCVDASNSRYVSGEAVVADADGRVDSAILVTDDTASSLIVRNVSEHGASRGTLFCVRMADVGSYSSADIKRMRIGRYPYWHYAFDLGEGVTVRETLKGGMANHRLNQRILMRLLETNFSLAGAKTCLDAACSSGYHSFALAERGLTVTAIDIDEPSIEQARFVQSCQAASSARSVDFRRQDLLAYDASAPYDYVFCSGLFYHLRDLVGGARKLFELSKDGGVVHSCVSSAPGDIMELADHRKFYCCFPGEFSFVPTASLLEKIFRHVGFTVRRYAALELCDDSDLASLELAHADLVRKHTAYYVLTK